MTLVAFVVVQVSVEDTPAAIDDGLALNVAVGAGTLVTVTVACFVTVPPAPVAVSVYVVVAVGLTEILPLRGRLPRPLSIVTDVAFVVVHVRVDDCPLVIVVGLAVKVALGGVETVTVTCFVTVPPAPVAVSVYVVVTEGETPTDPLAGSLPTPLSIVTLVAFVVDHVSVALCPGWMEVGLAEKEAVGAGAATMTETLSKSASPLVELPRISCTCA